MTETITEAPAKAATKKATVKKVSSGVSEDKFNELAGLVGSLAKSMSEIKDLVEKKTATPEEAKQTKEVEKAKSDEAPMNPAWAEKAREILGEKMDHCYVVYPKGGGTIFTIVVAKEHSNATPQYLEMYKIDRRTREIGSEGIAGVETLAKLVKQNLNRNRATN